MSDSGLLGNSVKNYLADNIDAVPTSMGADDLYTHTDYGLNWEDLGAVFPTKVMAVTYLGNGIVLAGPHNTHIYRSTDYGSTWTDLGSITVANIIPIESLGNGIVLVGDDANHIFRSTDYGLTWADLGVITSEEVRIFEYLGNSTVIMADTDGHIWRSTDLGINWNDLGEMTIFSFYISEYLGEGIVLFGGLNCLFRSSDYGKTWEDITSLVDTGTILAMTNLGNGIAILSGHHPYVDRTTDYGVTWESSVDITMGDMNTMKYLGNGVVIMIESGGSVWRSTDYGMTWTKISTSIHPKAGKVIEILGDTGICLIGTIDNHIWRSAPAFSESNFNPNQFDKLFQFGCLGAITPNDTSYLAPGNGTTQTNEITMRAPRPGILKNLYVQQRVASGAGGRTDIYTVRVNGADKTITCTLDNATQGADITHEVLVVAGDRISIKLVSNNANDTSADSTVTLELV